MRQGALLSARHLRCGPVRRAAGALAVLAVCACQSLPPVHGGVTYEGRFALAVNGDSRHEASSGRFTMTVDPPNLTVDLSTPLGTTVARVHTGPDGAQVTVPTTTGLKTERGPNADELSLQVLGWPLPVSGIGDWVQGRPVPGRPYRLEPGQDGSSVLEQDGWTIRFEARGSGGHLRRLQMNRPPQGDAPGVSLRVALDPGDL